MLLSRASRAAGPDLASHLGPAQPFDFGRLVRRAKDLAAAAYVPPSPPVPSVLQTINFDATQKIRFRPDRSIWNDGHAPYPVRLFHLNEYANLPVTINLVSGGMARAVQYSSDFFEYGDAALPDRLPTDLGFAGFRVMSGLGQDTDWLAFLGASYFRSSGSENQYGISARGIAVNTGATTREEFPRFSEFWLEASESPGRSLTVFALLDGPSLTGAYRFDVAKEAGAIVDVHAELFPRNEIPLLGLAPLTSMYWYGENSRRRATDWRPEIHDSDGLALWTGSGERIWRPLINPPTVQTNSFVDTDPRGFGLMQRDRDFDHYQDDGAFYERRPGVWIEPKGNWGEGAVQLVEIPTDDEIHDNIVAFWQPKALVEKGKPLSIDYRLHWRSDAPFPPTMVGQVVATRIGQGGVPGQPRPANTKKFVVDFAGGPLKDIEQRFDLTPVVTASRGAVRNAYVIKVVGTGRWRALFDLEFSGKDPVNLRCFVRLDDRTLTETWLYNFHPAA